MRFLLVILFFSISVSAQTDENSKNYNQNSNPQETIDLIIKKFMQLEQDYLIKLNHKDYTRSKRIISEVEELIKSLPLQEEIIPGISPISDNDFKRLFDEIKVETFESDQLIIIQTAGLYQFFTVLQMSELLDLFTFPSGKIEAVKALYPNIIDKQNSHLIIGKFNHSSDKETVRKLISSF
jgi:hypothetical protein